MGASATLLKFAKSREAAYLQHGRLTASRARAVTRIRQVADFFSRQHDQVQLRAVTQVEAELLELLPSEDSRYTKIRETILDLIAQAKNHFSHASTRIPVSQAAHGRADRNPGGNQGTQLSFI